MPYDHESTRAAQVLEVNIEPACGPGVHDEPTRFALVLGNPAQHAGLAASLAACAPAADTGEPVPDDVRRDMECWSGRDLSQILVHPGRADARGVGKRPRKSSAVGRMSLPRVLARLMSSRTPVQKARACLRSLPLAQLLQVLENPALRDQLPRLAPLLRVSDVVPSLQRPGMIELLLPSLDPSQCKLLGPELATSIAPSLHLNWRQLSHLPFETVILVPTGTFSQLPLEVLDELPEPHRQFVAPHVKAAGTPNRDEHDLALCQGLCQILHLYVHKVLDPEHIPGISQLRARTRDRSLRAHIQVLRWLVDAVMASSVTAVQISALKLGTLIVALRKVGLTELADELAHTLEANKPWRGRCYGADGVAYTRSEAVGVRHARIGEADRFAESQHTRAGGAARIVQPLAAALNDASGRHAGVADSRHEHPLPSERYTAIIAIDLAAASPPETPDAADELEEVLREQLGEPRGAVAIREVQLRWADGSSTLHQRRSDGRYPGDSRADRYGA